MVLQAPRATPQEGRHNLMRCHKLWSGIAQNPKVKCSEPQIDRVGMVGYVGVVGWESMRFALDGLGHRTVGSWWVLRPKLLRRWHLWRDPPWQSAPCEFRPKLRGSFPKKIEVKTTKAKGFQHTFSTAKIAALISLTSLETFRHVQSHKKIA